MQIAKAMPKMAQLMQDHQQNIIASQLTYHQSSERHRNQIQADLNDCTEVLKPVSLIISRLNQGGINMRTQFILDDITMPSTTSSLPSNPVGLIASESAPVVSEDPVIQYRLDANVTIIPRLWEEYDQGIVSTPGATRDPSIRGLDDRFGIKWRRADPYRKQYARRRYIWEAILRASKNLEMSPEIVAEKMERWRCNHSYTLNKVNALLSAIAPDMPGPWGEKDVELRYVV
jgi:Transcriptional activator of glycolytic enzymes